MVKIYVYSESGSFVEMSDSLVEGIRCSKLDGVDGGVDGDCGGEPKDQRERDPCCPNPLNVVSDAMA